MLQGKILCGPPFFCVDQAVVGTLGAGSGSLPKLFSALAAGCTADIATAPAAGGAIQGCRVACQMPIPGVLSGSRAILSSSRIHLPGTSRKFWPFRKVGETNRTSPSGQDGPAGQISCRLGFRSSVKLATVDKQDTVV